MYRNGETDKIWKKRCPARPSFDGSFIILCGRCFDFFQQMEIAKRTLFNRTRHSLSLPVFLNVFYCGVAQSQPLFCLLRRHADDPLDSLQRPALSDGYRASDSRPPCQSDVNYAHHCLLRQWLPGIQYARGGSRLNANAIAHNALLWLAASPMRPLNGRFARLCPAAFQYSESLYRPEYYEPATYSPLE